MLLSREMEGVLEQQRLRIRTHQQHSHKASHEQCARHNGNFSRARLNVAHARAHALPRVLLSAADTPALMCAAALHIIEYERCVVVVT